MSEVGCGRKKVDPETEKSMDVQEILSTVLLMQEVRLMPELTIKVFLPNKYYEDGDKLKNFEF